MHIIHNCKLCNFETVRLTDFNRHCGTTKHIKNTENSENRTVYEEKKNCHKTGNPNNNNERINDF